jgi:transposase
MTRPVSGQEHIEAARALMKKARTADELRLAQSVLLPLELGLSIDETASAIGRSKGATCTMRTRFCKIQAGELAAPQTKKQLRNRANADLAEEAKILDDVLADTAKGGIVVIPQFQQAIEAKLGKPVAPSTIYRMLARHGWRKLAPDTYHPKGDPQAREDWKKNSPVRWSKL